MMKISSELVFNWDHTGTTIVPGSQWTMEAKGSKRVELAGLNDKRQITAVFCASLAGKFLPAQLIYQGKTMACLPWFVFPDNWDVTYTPNHWRQDEGVHLQHNCVVRPKDLKLAYNYPALAIYDEFKGQLTPGIFSLLDANQIFVVFCSHIFSSLTITTYEAPDSTVLGWLVFDMSTTCVSTGSSLIFFSGLSVSILRSNSLLVVFRSSWSEQANLNLHGKYVPPWARLYEYCLLPVTSHIIVSVKRNIEEINEISFHTWPTTSPSLTIATANQSWWLSGPHWQNNTSPVQISW